MSRRPVSSNASEFEAPKSKYAPEDFIIPSKDSKGESVRVWNRIQPGHDRAISVIMNSRKFPFKTPGDVFRWCLHEGLKRLERMEQIPSVTQQVEAMMGMLRDEEFHQEFQTFLSHATTVIQRHINEGAKGEATRLVAQLKHKIQEMPHGHWRSKYLKAIDTQFGHLLDGKGGRAVAIGKFNSDDDE